MGENEKTGICVVCGKTFTYTSNRGAKVCSPECRKKHNAMLTAERRKAQKTHEQVRAEVSAACPNMTTEYYNKHEENILHQRDPEVWGTAPNDYAEKQRQKTLAMMQKIQPAEIVPKKEENKEDVKKVDRDNREQILVYMKGLIAGAAPFCQDMTVADLLKKLLAGVNALLDNEEVKL